MYVRRASVRSLQNAGQHDVHGRLPPPLLRAVRLHVRAAKDGVGLCCVHSHHVTDNYDVAEHRCADLLSHPEPAGVSPTCTDSQHFSHIFLGFYVPLSNMNVYLQAALQLSFATYGFAGLLVNKYRN